MAPAAEYITSSPHSHSFLQLPIPLTRVSSVLCCPDFRVLASAAATRFIGLGDVLTAEMMVESPFMRII